MVADPVPCERNEEEGAAGAAPQSAGEDPHAEDLGSESFEAFDGDLRAR